MPRDKKKGSSFSDQLSNLASRAAAAGVFGSRRKIENERREKERKKKKKKKLFGQ